MLENRWPLDLPRVKQRPPKEAFILTSSDGAKKQRTTILLPLDFLQEVRQLDFKLPLLVPNPLRLLVEFVNFGGVVKRFLGMICCHASFLRIASGSA